MKAFARRGLAALSLALTATACSSQPGPADRTLVVYDGTTGGFAPDFNPFAPRPPSPSLGLIYQPLMYFNLGRQGDVQPLLATSYEWAPDGRTLTFTLRPNMTWSDGQPITVDDVLYVFNTLEADPAINTHSVPYAGATAPDAHHVAVTFTRPAYTYLWYVAGQTWIVPEHLWRAITDPAHEPDIRPVGSGPYRLESFTAQAIELTKNTGYWDTGKPKVDSIRWVSFPDDRAAVDALANDRVHWGAEFIPGIDRTYVARNPAAHRYLHTSRSITVLVPNLDAGPTRDFAVRLAIDLGMDRVEINESAFSRYDTPASQSLLLIPRDRKWEPTDLSDSLYSDPATAERLLVRAGYTKGADGIYAGAGGTKLTIGVKAPAEDPGFTSALQVLQVQMAKIGIDLQPQPEPYPSYYADLESGRFDLAIADLPSGPEPYYLYDDFLRSTNTEPIGQAAGHDFARYRDPATDQALDVIASTNDENVKKEEYSVVAHQVAKNLPYLPILQTGTFTEMNTGEFTGWPTQDDPYAQPVPSYGPDMGIVAANLAPAR